MTTINNLTIEQMREIVDGAPTQDCFYDTYEGLFYSKDHDHYWEWWDSDCKEWFECEFVVNQNEDGFIHLNDLRTAIAKHDTAWMEKRFGIKKWYPIPEHHMCSDKRTDDTTDHVTDIRNHVSPSTIVKDLEAERHG